MPPHTQPTVTGWRGVASRRNRTVIARHLRGLRNRTRIEWSSGRNAQKTAAWFGMSEKRFESFVHSEIGLARNPTILDVGCADGALLRDVKRIAGENVRTVGLSLVKVPHTSGVDFFRRKTVEKLNEDKKYDMVFGIAVVGHTINPILSIQNMLNSAKVGGVICVSDFGLVGRVVFRLSGVDVLLQRPSSFIVRRTKRAKFDLSPLIEQFDAIAGRFPVNRSFEALRFI